CRSIRYGDPFRSSSVVRALTTRSTSKAYWATHSIDTIPIRGILEPNRDASLRRESMRYADVSRKEKKCLDFTSLTVEEFEELVPIFEEEFQEYMKTHCLDGKERVGRKYQTYSNCPLPTPEERLFFLLVYLKTNNLQGIHGELFGMSQGKANQWIHTLLPVLQ